MLNCEEMCGIMKEKRICAMELVSTVGVSLLSGVIYDTVKFITGKFISRHEKHKEKKEIIQKINNDIYIGITDEVRNVLDSSTFVQYLKSSRFLDVINAYLEQKIITNYASEYKPLKNHINSGEIITTSTVISYITDELIKLYNENKVISTPSKENISGALDQIIQTCEKSIASNLSPENSQMLYIINSRIDEIGYRVIKYIFELQNRMQMIEKKLFSTEFDTSNFEETKKQYYDILKDKNSDAHIYLLDKFPFDSFYVPPILHKTKSGSLNFEFGERRRIERYVEWNNIFLNDNIVYVVGGAGYGKSLFQKNIINNYQKLNIFRADEYIVLYGDLKSFYPNNSDTPISVVEFLKNSIRSSTLIEVSDEFVRHYLDSGRCIILLDALDEVDKTKRNALNESVASFFKKQNPNNKICITSREKGFLPEKDIEVFNIYPLNRAQIEEYVDKIIALGKFEAVDKPSFVEQTEQLISKGFLNSFLVLSLLVNIYKAERELPENKLELYQKCFDYIANKREKEKTVKEFDWTQLIPLMKDSTFIELSRMCLPNNASIDKMRIKEELLEVYKNKFSCEAELENALEEFLKFCSERTELFVPSEEEKFKFFHRSFFEYFYSKYITKRFHSAEQRLNELKKFDIDSEIFELSVAMLKQDDEHGYQALIDLMFKCVDDEFKREESDFQVFNILVLSMQVVDDAAYREKFVQIIVNNKEAILKNIQKLQNLHLCVEIFKNSPSYSNKIADAYEDEALLSLLKNCVELFDFVDEEHEFKLNKLLERELSTPDMFMLRRRKMLDRKDNYCAFYIRVYTSSKDCREVLKNIDNEKVIYVHKMFRPNNYKKPSQEAIEALQKYRKLSSKQQKNALKIITSYFGWLNDFIFIA